MTIRNLKSIIDNYLENVPETHDGEIRVWHGKKEYEIRTVSGGEVLLRLNIETGAKTYDEYWWERDKWIK
jgi:hypothetical protein